MKPITLCVLSAFALGTVLTQQAAAQCVSLTAGAGQVYTQDFDSLATSGTTNPLSITGWSLSESGTSSRNNQQYAADDGGSNTGDTYSYGVASSSDRALGMLQSSSILPVLGACFTNNTGSAISSFDIHYTGKQFRVGSANRDDRVDFQFSLDAVSLTTGTWIDVDALDYSGPQNATTGIVSPPASALVGPQSISGLSIANGNVFWIRWNDFNASGSDDGLAVDDFSLTATVSGGGMPTNPTATGTATTVTVGGTTTLEGTIIPGTNPDSQSYTVSCDLSSVGGANPQALDVSGTSFSYGYAVPVGTAPQIYSLPCGVTDDESRSSTFNISLTVNAPFTCGAPKTLISAIQGAGASSPLVGQVEEVEGIVTGSFQTPSKLNGFFVQDEGDGDAATSDGIFINESIGSLATVSVGDRVRVRGTVAETFGQTTLGNITSMTSCGAGLDVTPTDVVFPVASTTFLERFEGMLVRFPQQTRVTDNYNLGRFNEVGLAYVPDYVNGVDFSRLMTPTQVVPPGSAAIATEDLNNRSRIILDDGNNVTYGGLSPLLTYPLDGGGLSASNTLRLGDRVNVDPNGIYTPLIGVMSYDFGSYRMHPTGTVFFGPSDNPRPTTAPVVNGRVRVVSANVLNYFTTFTENDPNARGADNAAEFQRQRDKIIAAIKKLDPDVIGLSELENNASASLEDLVNDSVYHFGNSLNEGNPGKWAYISTGVVGTDAIRVGFVYQPAVVTPVGSFKVLDSSVDPRALSTRNRPSIAQTFQLLSGARPDLQHFTVVVNHFKSKGSACTSDPSDPDTGDGQANCNLSRTSMAQALIDWLATNPTGDPTPVADRRFLIIGDLNAYLMEDPILALTNAAFNKPPTTGFPNGFPADPNATYKDLIKALGDPAGYSYLFGGESGALDHALANPALYHQITRVSEWHINADEPVVLDYNSDFDGNSNHSQQKSADQLNSYYNSGPFRTSDHDPLVVGFNPLLGDLNDDGVVNWVDQILMARAVGKIASGNYRRADYDGDGKVTVRDYFLWNGYLTAYKR